MGNSMEKAQRSHRTVDHRLLAVTILLPFWAGRLLPLANQKITSQAEGRVNDVRFASVPCSE